MKNLLVAIILGVLIPSGAKATTWYVAKTGSDSNSCSTAQNSNTPKLTIGAGLACVGSSGAGHTVQVASGTYAETISSFPSGTSGSPFTLKSASALGAIIRPNATSSQILFIASNYVVIDGIVTDGTNVSANNVWIDVGVTGVTIQNCEIKNIRSGDGTGTGSFQALYVQGATNLLIKNNHIHDVAVGYSIHASHAIYWASGNSIIEGNTIHNISGDAVQIYTEHGYNISNNTIRNNKIYDYGTGPTSGLTMTGTNCLAYNNIVYQSTFNPDAYGILVRGSGNKILNNTVYNNAVGIDTSTASSAEVRNNILWQNGYNRGGGDSFSNNLTSDPKFVNISSRDFHLQSTSPAIDAGITVASVTTDADMGTRPGGNGYDIGAYEYASGPVTPTPPTNLRIF